MDGAVVEMKLDEESSENLEISETLILEYEELNKKIEAVLEKIHKRHGLNEHQE